jgi:hypothetical protein
MVTSITFEEHSAEKALEMNYFFDLGQNWYVHLPDKFIKGILCSFQDLPLCRRVIKMSRINICPRTAANSDGNHLLFKQTTLV